MQKDILRGNYTSSQTGYQFKLPLEFWYHIPDDDPVRLLYTVVDDMDLTELHDTYGAKRRQMKYPPEMLLRIVLYGYMNHEYSTRRIAERCRRDVNFMFLLDGRPAPDYTTIARFRAQHFAPCAKNIMAEMSRILSDLGETSGLEVFIDGTKIEANANKYKFVWKKATLTNQSKLHDKIVELMQLLEDKYDLKAAAGDEVCEEDMVRMRTELLLIGKTQGVEFVSGRGHHKTELQRDVEKLEGYLERHREYVKRLEICGEDRNSYAKTDPDATFMRMKEDAMGNGQLKAAYNVQHGVDSEYIVWAMISQQTTDTPTLIPFLSEMHRYLPFLDYKDITADAGYESEENYRWLETADQNAYIKPTNYEISKKRKYRNDIGRPENMIYDQLRDEYTCANGKTIAYIGDKTRKTKSGYVRTSKVYECSECDTCQLKEKCLKGHSRKPLEERSKRMEISPDFSHYRQEAVQRITDEHGVLLRVNRSIQAEGSFGELKQNMGFRRFLCRGCDMVLSEIILLAISANINKLHNKIQAERTGSWLFPLKDTA